MTVKELKNQLKRNSRREVRCCVATRGCLPLCFGFLKGAIVCQDEVRLTAIKPHLYSAFGQNRRYYEKTMTEQELAKELNRANEEATVRMSYHDEKTNRYFHTPVDEFGAFRAMVVLWAPTKKAFMKSLLK